MNRRSIRLNGYDYSQAGKLRQRNFYEHIIRDQGDYERIANYIWNNPANWDHDHENPVGYPQIGGELP